MKSKLNKGEKELNESKDIAKKSPDYTKKTKNFKDGIWRAGKKIKKSIRIIQLKKKLSQIKFHISGNNKPSRVSRIGPEEKKLRTLLKELDMLKKFNMLGFDSDAINLLLGLYYLVETIEMEAKAANFLANDTVPEQDKSAALESLLHECWKKVQLLPTYKERTALKYQHLGTKVVIEKLYSKQKFVEPLNEIINKINEYIKKRDIAGLLKEIKRAEIFCEDIKKMSERPEKRVYTGSTKSGAVKRAKNKKDSD